MGKGKSFAAKVAHQSSSEGKVMCATCNVEIKKIKLIMSRDSKAQTWAPRYEMKNICKCNEQDILKGNV